MSFSRDISLVALANTLLWIVFPPRFDSRDGEGKKKNLWIGSLIFQDVIVFSLRSASRSPQSHMNND